MAGVLRRIGIAVVIASLAGSPALAIEPEKIWRELVRASGRDKQKLLLSNARAEGEVHWYNTLGADLVDPLRNNFEKLYPGVKLIVWRARGDGLSNRILTEASAQKFIVDVITGSNEHFPALMKAGLVGRYSSPERNIFADGNKDREGYWTSLLNIITVIAYNTDLVAKKDAPNKYEDFLDPRWKGSFAIDKNPDRLVMGWLKIWGTDKTEEVLARLMKNSPVLRSSHSLIAQLLCAGEFKAAIELYAPRLPALKNKGCPIEIVLPHPALGAVTPLSVAKRSPHPHGAALLIDYLLSESAQRIITEQGFYSGRRGLKPPYAELDLETSGVRALLLNPEDLEQHGKKYFELQERYLIAR